MTAFLALVLQDVAIFTAVIPGRPPAAPGIQVQIQHLGLDSGSPLTRRPE
jgi:hypothetical protein